MSESGPFAFEHLVAFGGRHEALPNIVKRRLRASEPVFLMALRMARTVDAAALALASEHHGFLVDLDQGTMALDLAAQICQAGLALGLTPLLRIAATQTGAMQRLLNAGAQGVIAADTGSADQARAVVEACRFPPAGRRAMPSTDGPHTLFDLVVPTKLHPPLNDFTLVICALQAPATVREAETIGAVEGVDALMVDLIPLSTELRVPGQTTHALVMLTVEAALAAGSRLGKPVILSGLADADAIGHYAARGAARCYVTGDDRGFMLAGARLANAALKLIDERL